jgi:hypothetical protein
MKQKFKSNGSYFKLVKDISVELSVKLKVEVLRTKCLNPHCKVKSFTIFPKGIERYSRATQRLKQEAICGLINDNSTTPRIAKRFERIFNTTGSKSSIDRWKHKEADKLDIKEIISKLNFSGILCVDEYKPKRYKGYDLIDSDALTGRILYLEKAEGLGRGIVREHFEKLKELGINPYAIIFDMRSCFAGTAKKVFGKNILIQHDYFHVMKIIHYHLNRAMAEYRRKLKEEGIDTLDIWQARWVILKNIEDWTFKEHIIIENLLSRYKGTIIEDILILKQKIRDIFLESKSCKEAIERRDELLEESWYLKSKYFANIIKFLTSPYFKYTITYLDHPQIPKSGNSENVIRTWRQMEKVRYGFKTEKGRLNHLKLYQIHKYLGVS